MSHCCTEILELAAGRQLNHRYGLGSYSHLITPSTLLWASCSCQGADTHSACLQDPVAMQNDYTQQTASEPCHACGDVSMLA